ncbi:transcription factor DIVARICATA-like [Nymphaea colorata]|nr:transcription factor DIVARICATA-like [Nymphaea colorata]
MFARDFCCSCSFPWTWEENKRFELYLAKFPDDTPDRWHTMASFMQGRTPLELKLWYEKLLLDVAEIESGRVEPPWPQRESNEEDDVLVEEASPTSSTGAKSEPERKKGVPWTEEEHRLFLIGLEKYGKGDWRSISRNAVISRTPTQVASHAQKYFIRQGASKKERKRASIHDITTANLEEPARITTDQSMILGG